MYKTTDQNGKEVYVTLAELIKIEEIKLIALFEMSKIDPV